MRYKVVISLGCGVLVLSVSRITVAVESQGVNNLEKLARSILRITSLRCGRYWVCVLDVAREAAMTVDFILHTRPSCAELAGIPVFPSEVIN